MQYLQDIVSVEETSIPLPKDIWQMLVCPWCLQSSELTHRNAKQAYKDLNTSDSHESICDIALDEPVVRTEREAEAENILEYHHASKCLNCNVSYLDRQCLNMATGNLENYGEHRRGIKHWPQLQSPCPWQPSQRRRLAKSRNNQPCWGWQSRTQISQQTLL